MYLNQQYFIISATMSAISRAMVLLMDTFEKYAGKDGQPNMSKSELSDLLRAEFPEPVSRTDGHPLPHRAENDSLSYF